MIKIGINGYNELARTLLRMVSEGNRDMTVTKINKQDADTAYMAYQLRYSSVYGRFPGRIAEDEGSLTVGNTIIRISGEHKPEDADWSQCDIVIDCEGSGKEIKGRKVILSGATVDVPSVDFGLNHIQAKSERMVAQVLSETSAIAVTAAVINREFGIENGISLTTVPMDETSRGVDVSDSFKWRNGRSMDSVIPAVCGGAQGAGDILHELSGKLSGISLRVPVKSVSLLNLVCKLKEKTDYSAVVEAMKKASENEFKGLIGVTDEGVVSCDFKGCPLSAVIDVRAGLLQGGNLLKLSAWYDGIRSHGTKLLNLASYMGSL